jgi:hypothetical protein
MNLANPKTNGSLSSFVEKPKKEEKKLNFMVYRKRWLWGEKFFCLCQEVMEFENVFLMKADNMVIAILPSNSFSCAIAVEYKENDEKSI